MLITLKVSTKFLLLIVEGFALCKYIYPGLFVWEVQGLSYLVVNNNNGLLICLLMNPRRVPSKRLTACITAPAWSLGPST